MIAVWLALGSVSSWAQTAEPPAELDQRVAQAKELYRLGAGLYEAGRYAEAIGTFEEAYELSGNPKLLFNLANAHERLGDLQAAVDDLTQYRPFAESQEQVALDLRISALLERIDATQPIEQPAPPPPPPPPPERRRRNGPRWAVVGAGSVAAIGFGTVASVSYAQGRSARTAGDREVYTTRRTLNGVSVPAAGVGVGVAILGLAWPRPARPSDRAQVSVDPAGVRLTLPL